MSPILVGVIREKVFNANKPLKNMKKENKRKVITLILIVILLVILIYSSNLVISGKSIFGFMTGVFDSEDNGLKVIKEIRILGGNFCGNGICEERESFENCPEDCWPNSDKKLSYMSYMDFYSSKYAPYYNRIINASLIPDIKVLSFVSESEANIINEESRNLVRNYNDILTIEGNINSSLYDPKEHYDNYLNYFSSQSEKTVLGRYLSGRDCHYNITRYPVNQLNCSLFSEENFRADYSPYEDLLRKSIDLSKEDNLILFGDLIIEEALKFERDFIYFDNINHNDYNALVNTPYTWENITTLLKYVRNNLSKEGVRTTINIAARPFRFAENNFKDANILIETVDGISFESPFHRNIRNNLSLLEGEIRVYRRFLDNKKLIMLIPVTPSQASGDNFSYNWKRYFAAMIMIFREEEDSIFLSDVYYRSQDFRDWEYWPEQYGRPLNNYSVIEEANSFTLKREFENGNIYVQNLQTTQNKGILFRLPEIVGDYELINSPAIGKLRYSGEGNLIYYPNSTYTDSEMFSFGSNFNGEFFEDLVIVNIRTIEGVCIPTGEEICDLIDNNCNGEIDEGGVCDFLCGNGVCDLFETSNSCAIDCGSIYSDNYFEHYLKFYQIRFGSHGEDSIPLPLEKVELTIGNPYSDLIHYPYLSITNIHNHVYFSRKQAAIDVVSLNSSRLDEIFELYSNEDGNIRKGILQRLDIEDLYEKKYPREEYKFGVETDENLELVFNSTGHLIDDSPLEDYHNGKTILLPIRYTGSGPETRIHFNFNNPVLREYAFLNIEVLQKKWNNNHEVFMDNFLPINRLGLEENYKYLGQGNLTEKIQRQTEYLLDILKMAKSSNPDTRFILNGYTYYPTKLRNIFLDTATKPENVDSFDGIMIENYFYWDEVYINVDDYLKYVSLLNENEKEVFFVASEKEEFEIENSSLIYRIWLLVHLFAQENTHIYLNKGYSQPMINYLVYNYPLGLPLSEPYKEGDIWYREYQRGLISLNISDKKLENIKFIENPYSPEEEKRIPRDSSGTSDTKTSSENIYPIGGLNHHQNEEETEKKLVENTLEEIPNKPAEISNFIFLKKYIYPSLILIGIMILIIMFLNFRNFQKSQPNKNPIGLARIRALELKYLGYNRQQVKEMFIQSGWDPQMIEEYVLWDKY